MIILYLERAVFRLAHLSFREHLVAHSKGILFAMKELSELPFWSRMKLGINGIKGTVGEYLSIFAGKARTSRIHTTPEKKLQALQLIDEVDRCEVYTFRFLKNPSKGLSGYKNCTEEVSARMYSMFRRLEVLNEEMQVVTRVHKLDEMNLLSLRTRLRALIVELGSEPSTFFQSHIREHVNQLAHIKTLLSNIREFFPQQGKPVANCEYVEAMLGV